MLGKCKSKAQWDIISHPRYGCSKIAYYNNVGKKRETLESSNIIGGNGKWCNLFGKLWHFPIKVEKILQVMSEIDGNFSKEKSPKKVNIEKEEKVKLHHFLLKLNAVSSYDPASNCTSRGISEKNEIYVSAKIIHKFHRALFIVTKGGNDPNFHQMMKGK